MNKIEEWIKEVKLITADVNCDPDDCCEPLIEAIRIIEHLMKAVEFYSKNTISKFTGETFKGVKIYWDDDGAFAKEAIEACENIIKEK